MTLRFGDRADPGPREPGVGRAPIFASPVFSQDQMAYDHAIA
jgi:hypothetical protein